MSRLHGLLPTLSVLLCTASVACGAQPAGLDQNAGNNTSDIVGGRTTTGFSAVGAFINYDVSGQGFDLCTATYIGNSRLITAAHCVLALDPNGGLTPTLANVANLGFYTGNTINGTVDQSEVYNVARVAVPPGFNFQTFISNGKRGSTNNNDIAMVELASDPNINYAPVSTTAIGSKDVGQPLTLIGYGTTGTYGDSTTAGTKRTVTVSLDQYNNYLLEAGTAKSGTCSGDSGGPAAMGGTLVGVTQAGSTDSSGRCIGQDIFTRVDTYQQFIANF